MLLLTNEKQRFPKANEPGHLMFEEHSGTSIRPNYWQASSHRVDSFFPHAGLSPANLAAVLLRIADPQLRLSLRTLRNLTGTWIATAFAGASSDAL